MTERQWEALNEMDGFMRITPTGGITSIRMVNDYAYLEYESDPWLENVMLYHGDLLSKKELTVLRELYDKYVKSKKDTHDE